MGPDVVINDEQIFAYVGKVMGNLNANQQLQKLAKENGLDVKNSLELTEENKNKVAISTVSLILAKRAGDPKYDMLCRTGLQKRALKAEIINSYKEEAKQLITKFENRMTEN